MEVLQNLEVPSGTAHPIMVDVYLSNTKTPKPVVLFNHGFKGFKNWGYWHVLGRHFANADIHFVAFNQSHGGIGKSAGDYFEHLDAFAHNTYSRELHDLEQMVEWLFGESIVAKSGFQRHNVHLMGHSRGGSTAILFGSHHPKIASVVSWAGFSAIPKRFNQKHYENWAQKETVYIPNARTKQEMPQHISIYHDYEANQERLSIKNALKATDKPILLVHGTEDPTVPFQDALEMKSWCPSAELFPVLNANHVFGGQHPWEHNDLPNDAQLALNTTLRFLRNHRREA